MLAQAFFGKLLFHANEDLAADASLTLQRLFVRQVRRTLQQRTGDSWKGSLTRGGGWIAGGAASSRSCACRSCGA